MELVKKTFPTLIRLPLSDYLLNPNQFKANKSSNYTNINTEEIIEIETGEQYASKKYKVKNDEYVASYLEACLTYKNPFTVNFKGFWIQTRSRKIECTLVFDKCLNNPLRRILDLEEIKLKEIGWDDTKKLIVIYGVAVGMSILHSEGFVHRDLKPDTIFLDDRLFPKIGGLSKFINIGFNLSFDNTLGKPSTAALYMAPEFFRDYEESENYDKNPAIDVYSFGITLFEIMTNEKPFGNNPSVTYIVEQIISEKRPEFNQPIPDCYKKLIERCWAQDPKDRPSFADIVKEIETNPQFITENVNEKEFRDYIAYTKDPESHENNFKKVNIEFEIKTKHLSVDLKQTDLSLYEKIKNIGSGAFAKVYKVFETTTGNVYACKISRFELNFLSDESIQNMERELMIMSKIQHPSILKFIGYNQENFKKQPRTTIITELISNGSLDIILALERKGLSGEEWNDTRKLITIYGVASGMSYLHSQDILHRDLKPGNIFMDEYLFPKIGDFGMSKIVPNDSIIENFEQRSNVKGTPAYIAPEIIDEHLYCKAGDVYAFGMIVYEIMTSEVLYPGLHPFQVELLASKGVRPKFNQFIPKCYREMIERCWENNPEQRPTFEEIVDSLRNDPEFIIDTIDEEEYLNYIDYIDEMQTKKKATNDSGESADDESFLNDKFQKVTINLSLAEEQEEYDEDLIDDPLDLSNYEKVKVIQKDCLFSEFEVKEKEIGQTYLAKVSNIQIDKLKRDEMIQLSREVNIMSQINHPSIIKFIGYSPTDFNNKHHSVLVTEITHKGTLSNLLEQEKQNENVIDATNRLIILYGISSGMSYLHSHKIIHRNLIPDSIYFDDRMFPKIGNFELCARNHTLESMTFQSTSGVKGRPSYSSPEILQNNNYSKSGDVYSFGMLVYELVTKKTPFGNQNTINQVIKEVVFKSSRPEIDESIPKCYQELIEICWSQSPEERPSFEDITSILKNDQRFISDDVDSKKYHIYVRYIEESDIQFYSSGPIVRLDELLKNKQMNKSSDNLPESSESEIELEQERESDKNVETNENNETIEKNNDNKEIDANKINVEREDSEYNDENKDIMDNEDIKSNKVIEKSEVDKFIEENENNEDIKIIENIEDNEVNKIILESEERGIHEVIEENEGDEGNEFNATNECSDNHEATKNNEDEEGIEFREGNEMDESSKEFNGISKCNGSIGNNAENYTYEHNDVFEEKEAKIVNEDNEIIENTVKNETTDYMNCSPPMTERTVSLKQDVNNEKVVIQNQDTNSLKKSREPESEKIDELIRKRRAKELMNILNQSFDDEMITAVFDRCFSEDSDFYHELCLEGIAVDNTVSHHKYALWLIFNANHSDQMNEAEKHLKHSIERGYLLSYFSLSRLQLEVFHDYESAFQSAKEGIERGELNCRFLLGYFIANGFGVQQNRQKGIRTMIESGNESLCEPFMTEIGLYYVSQIKNKEKTPTIKSSISFEQENRNDEEDHEDISAKVEEEEDEEKKRKAFECFEKAFNLKKTRATINNLGICFMIGFGVRRDIEKAKSIFKEGELLGYWNSSDYLSFICEPKKEHMITQQQGQKESRIESEIETNEKECLAQSLSAEKRISDTFYVKDVIERAIKHYKSGEFEESMKCITPFLQMNHPIAKYLYGVMKFFGQGCEENRNESYEIMIYLSKSGIDRATEFIEQYFD